MAETTSSQSTDVTQLSELERLAEEDGALFTRSLTGSWSVCDADGAVISRGALSRAEAAVLYCEDRNLTASTPEAILARIRYSYRPYDSMPEFEEGYLAYTLDGPRRRSPYNDGVKAQAFDRGANAAMLYARALAHLDAHKEDVEKAGPGWLMQLLRTGRL
jgi:hypothetical protein